VFTGCNNGSASVVIDEEVLTFEPLVLTRVACDGETGEMEAAQTAVLDGEVAYELDEGSLTLTKADRSLTYRSG
jgi:heat shock protein HslJ